MQALKNYRRAKGLCFTCGERYSREHKCPPTVQLHLVQEMIELMQLQDEECEEIDLEANLMQITDGEIDETPPEQSIILQCYVAGKEVVFLLDSGSTNSFLNSSLANELEGLQILPMPRRVKVAVGGILICDTCIPACTWTCGSQQFCSPFKVHPLKGYDGIIGMDWLSSHNPQLVDWHHKWLKFQYKGTWVCLQGKVPVATDCNMLSL